MLNLVNVLETTAPGELCAELGPVLRLVGIAIFIIKVIVPILLIVVGMIDMAKAVTEKDENKIKDAQHKLIKKAIAAVLVFLIVTIVGVLMNLIGAAEYKQCTDCIVDPWNCKVTDDGLIQN